MSLEPEEVKRAMKKTTEVMWGIREAFVFPFYVNPLSSLANNLEDDN